MDRDHGQEKPQAGLNGERGAHVPAIREFTQGRTELSAVSHHSKTPNQAECGQYRGFLKEKPHHYCATSRDDKTPARYGCSPKSVSHKTGQDTPYRSHSDYTETRDTSSAKTPAATFVAGDE